MSHPARALPRRHSPSRHSPRRVSRPAVSPPAWIFRQLTSMRVALVLLFILALLTLAGTLLDQAPDGVKGNPAAYAEWLNSVRSSYGGWTGVLNTLGLFSVFSSIWFRGTLLLLSASVVSCSTRRAPRLWRTATRPRMVMTEAFFERAPHAASVACPQDPAGALATVRTALRRKGFHIATASQGDDVHVCADRFRWAPFGRIIAHLAFVVIVIGAVVTGTTGFRDESFAIPVGDRLNVGHGTGVAVEAKSFADSYYQSGEPRNYASQLVLYKGGVPVKAQEDRVNHPVHYDGITFYQSFFGPASVMQVRTASGHLLFNQGVALIYESQNERDRIGRFMLPQQGLKVFVISPASGEVDPNIPNGAAEVEVYRGEDSNPVGTQVLSPGRPATVAGVKFTFVRESEFTGLIVASEPGSTIVWIGAAMLVLGLVMVFYFRHRRIRLLIRPASAGSEIGVAAIERRDAGFTSVFEHVVEDIRRAVNPSAPSEKEGTAHA